MHTCVCSSLLYMYTPAHFSNGGVILRCSITNRHYMVLPLITFSSRVHSGGCLGCTLLALLLYVSNSDKLHCLGLSPHIGSYFMPHSPGGSKGEGKKVRRRSKRNMRRRRKRRWNRRKGRNEVHTCDVDQLCPWSENFRAKAKYRVAAGASPQGSFAYPDIHPNPGSPTCCHVHPTGT